MLSEPNRPWSTTLDRNEARPYLGEIHNRPTVIANSMKRLFRQRPLPAFTLFYAGEIDEYIASLFGYDHAGPVLEPRHG